MEGLPDVVESYTFAEEVRSFVWKQLLDTKWSRLRGVAVAVLVPSRLAQKVIRTRSAQEQRVPAATCSIGPSASLPGS